MNFWVHYLILLAFHLEVLGRKWGRNDSRCAPVFFRVRAVPVRIVRKIDEGIFRSPNFWFENPKKEQKLNFDSCLASLYKWSVRSHWVFFNEHQITICGKRNQGFAVRCFTYSKKRICTACPIIFDYLRPLLIRDCILLLVFRSRIVFLFFLIVVNIIIISMVIKSRWLVFVFSFGVILLVFWEAGIEILSVV